MAYYFTISSYFLVFLKSTFQDPKKKHFFLQQQKQVSVQLTVDDAPKANVKAH